MGGTLVDVRNASMESTTGDVIFHEWNVLRVRYETLVCGVTGWPVLAERLPEEVGIRPGTTSTWIAVSFSVVQGLPPPAGGVYRVALLVL